MFTLRASLLLLLFPAVLSGAQPTPPDNTPELRFDAQGVRKGTAVAVLRNKYLKEEAGKATLPLAEQLTLTLAIEGTQPLIIVDDEKALLDEQVKALSTGNAWKVVASKPLMTTLPDKRERWEAIFTLDPRNKGDHDIQPTPISFRDGSGSEQKAAWKPIPVLVTTQLNNPQSATDLSQMRDITGPEDVPAEQKSKLWRYLLIALAVLLLVGAFVAGAWSVIRRRLGQLVPLPPNRWALRELARIESAGLVPERFHTELSDVVRHYLERRFGLRAPQQTTAEFLARMQSWPFLPAPSQALLRDFLERCDLAKFAGVSPSPEECRATARMAREFVEQTQAIDLKPA